MPTSPPSVSAIIPVYNRAWCIRRAAESVRLQEYRRLELIVVDDGSTDATPAVLDAVAAEWRRLPAAPTLRVLRQENRGVAAARNLGIRHASGECIALLDSDDEWLPGKLDRQTAALDADGGWMINQTGEIWMRRGVRVNPPLRLAKQSGDLFARSLDHCAISPSAVLLRRELLEEVGGFDPGYEACEDYELWLRVTCRHRVGLLCEPLLIRHGGRPDQLSASVPALDRLRIRALGSLLESEQLNPGQRAQALGVLAVKCRIYAQGCARRGRTEEAEAVRALAARLGAPASPPDPGGLAGPL